MTELHEKKKAAEDSLIQGCIEIATKVSEIYLFVTGAAFRPNQVSNLVMSCIENHNYAETVYNTVMDKGRGGEYDDFLSTLNWCNFLISLAVLNHMGVTQEELDK